MDEYPHVPARYPERQMVSPTKAPSVPMHTTIIPAVGKRPVRRPGIVPLNVDARKRTMHISAIVLITVVVLVLVSFTPLSALARPILPWTAKQNLALIPTPTPSRPVVWGEHDFVCAALPFARLAQQGIVTGPRAQPHPWYVSVILAQWGIEQGWHVPSYTGYNWANSSALAGFPSVSGTNQPGSPSAFAYADSAEQGVQVYVAFVQNGLYDAVSTAYAQGPEAQAYAIGASPWDAAHYTASGQPGSTIISVLHTFNLKRLDQPDATC